MPPAFEGIFVDAATSPTRFAGNRHVRSRAFPNFDQNDSARRLFSAIDVLLVAAPMPGYTMLTTLQSDLEARRFPEMLVAYFDDVEWSYESRYFLEEACKADRAGYGVGRLTIESAPGQIGRILAFNGGIRWGANLRVGGVQVPSANIRTALRLSPFEPEGALALQSMARLAWAGHRELFEFFVWTRDEQLLNALA